VPPPPAVTQADNDSTEDFLPPPSAEKEEAAAGQLEQPKKANEGDNCGLGLSDMEGGAKDWPV
jgi:hypothetical protein